MGSLSHNLSSAPYKAPRLFRPRAIIISALLLAVLVAGFVWWPRSPINLANARPDARAQLLQHWEAGEVVVLVRHAERCDRSSHPCLGPADGITRAGSDAAVAVGQGLMHLGMNRTDVLSSPLTRTAQTAHYMFGNDVQTQEWLATCGNTWRNDIVAHKREQRNLVLVTHSGCIGDFEALSGYKHAPTAEYGSSLFVQVGDNGKLQILGIVNADDWHSMSIDKH